VVQGAQVEPMHTWPPWQSLPVWHIGVGVVQEPFTQASVPSHWLVAVQGPQSPPLHTWLAGQSGLVRQVPPPLDGAPQEPLTQV
jgi:hypothetical protein